MAFSINYKELSAYVSSVTLMKNDFNKFLREFLLEMADRVIARVKPRTPVGTPESTGIPNYVGGALRRNWELGDIKGEGRNISVEILNGTDYATDIEYGHRIMGGSEHNVEVGWYEGRFMLKISIDEIRKQMPIRYQNEFKKFCIEHGLAI